MHCRSISPKRGSSKGIFDDGGGPNGLPIRAGMLVKSGAAAAAAAAATSDGLITAGIELARCMG
jgi:hypothetical protein